MKLKNAYVDRSRISERKFRQFLRYVAADIEATNIARFSRLNRNTVNRYPQLLRERVAEACEAEAPLRGRAEVDESYFGPRRVRGKRGRGAGRKTIVFSIFRRNGTVYAEIVPDVSRRTLQGVIRGRVDLRSVIHSDAWRGYDGLVDLGHQKHFRVRHGRNEFARTKGRAHINGIEAFWSSAKKTRLARLRGIQAQTFLLRLKECEFRFNHRKENLYTVFLDLVRRNPLN